MDFAINFTQASAVSSNMENVHKKMNAYYAEVNNVIKNYSLSSNASGSLLSTLRKIAAEIQEENRMVLSARNVLNQAVTSYRQTESRVVQSKDGNDGRDLRLIEGVFPNLIKIVGGDSILKKVEPTNPFKWSLSDTWKMIGNFGMIGNTISAIGTLWSGKSEPKTYVNFAKYISKIIGGAATAVDKKGTVSAWKESLFGVSNSLNGIDTSSIGSSFTSSMKKQLSDLSWTGAKTTASKVKVATKWAGNILTFVSNAFENKDEYEKGKISASRAVGETVIETAVDIGVGMAATAGATAAAAALVSAGVITAAPAVAVGAAAVGIAWAANGVCKWITQKTTGEAKDLGEVVADAFCDAKERQIKRAVNMAEKVTSSVSTLWKNMFKK